MTINNNIYDKYNGSTDLMGGTINNNIYDKYNDSMI